MATHTGALLQALEALTNAAVAVGETGQVTATDSIYICETADGAGSTWWPTSGFYDVRDLTTILATSWVQEAVNRAAASAVVKKVYCRGGVWSANAQVLVPSNIEIFGQGPGATLFRIGALAVPVFQTNAVWGPSPTINKPIFRDFAIDHPAAGPPGSAGINLRNAGSALIKNVQVRNLAEYGIRVGDESHFCILDQCDVRGGDVGFLFENGARSCHMVNACVVKNAATSVLVAQGPDSGISNWSASRCSFESFTTAVEFQALTLGGVFHCVVEDCRMESAGAVGVRIGVDTRFVGLYWNHHQGPLGTKVIDNTVPPAPSELLSVEMPIMVGAKMGDLAGSRFSTLGGVAGDPEGAASGAKGDVLFSNDGEIYRQTTGTSAAPSNVGWIPSNNKNRRTP